MKNTLFSIILPIYKGSLLDEQQSPNIQALIGEEQLNNLMNIISYAKKQSADIKLIWSYFPYKKNEYCNHNTGIEEIDSASELEICKDVLTNFIKYKRLEGYIEVLKFSDAYPIKNVQKTYFLLALLDNRVFGDIASALKLCSRSYNRKVYTNMVTFDCSSEKSNLLDKLQRFSEGSIKNALNITECSASDGKNIINQHYMFTDKKLTCLESAFVFINSYIEKKSNKKNKGANKQKDYVATIYLVDGVVDLLISIYKCRDHKLIKSNKVKQYVETVKDFLDNITHQFDQSSQSIKINEISRVLPEHLVIIQTDLVGKLKGYFNQYDKDNDSSNKESPNQNSNHRQNSFSVQSVEQPSSSINR